MHLSGGSGDGSVLAPVGSELDGSGADESDAEWSSAPAASGSVAFPLPVWVPPDSAVALFCFCFCFFDGLAGLSEFFVRSGFVASCFAECAEVDPDDGAPESDAEPVSANATPAPAIIAADTPR